MIQLPSYVSEYSQCELKKFLHIQGNKYAQKKCIMISNAVPPGYAQKYTKPFLTCS